MFLRANKRFKDGKEHRYWSVVENRRVTGGRSVQKTLLYLGEINDSDRSAWTRAIEAVYDSERTRQIHLFPEDRTPDPRLEHPTLQLRLSHIELARPRQWGGCWLALELWNVSVVRSAVQGHLLRRIHRSHSMRIYDTYE